MPGLIKRRGPHNRCLVFDVIQQQGAISRTEITQPLGPTVQTLSTIISELDARGFISLRPAVCKWQGFSAPDCGTKPDGGFAYGIYSLEVDSVYSHTRDPFSPVIKHEGVA